MFYYLFAEKAGASKYGLGDAENYRFVTNIDGVDEVDLEKEYVRSESPLATENLLENADGVRSTPPPREGEAGFSEHPHQCSLGTAACYTTPYLGTNLPTTTRESARGQRPLGAEACCFSLSADGRCR